MRTARDHTPGENLFVVGLLSAPFSQGLEPPANPALTVFVILGTRLAVVGVALVLFWAISGAGLPGRAELAGIPRWAWAGGASQGLTVLAVFLTAGRAGAAVFSALTVTGGAICSILLDHKGYPNRRR